MERLKTIVKKDEASALKPISDFTFSELVDISDLQQLITHFSELANCPVAILDTNNNFLASFGWKKICSCFHRIHPETKKLCSESDNLIKQNLGTKNPIAYKCKNGLWDVAYPIFIEKKHVANIFFGQFLFDDEEIDIPFFENQAEKYGFDKTEYLNCLNEVPRMSRKKTETLKDFSAILAQMITKTGYANLLLKKEKIEELRIANKQIKDSELKFRKLFEQVGVGVAQVQTSTGRFVKVNKKFADMLGYSIDEMLTLTFKEITHPGDLKESLKNQSLLLKKQIGEFSIEKRYVRKNGSSVWAILTASSMGEMRGESDFQIAVVQDITERKKAEQDLIDSELKFRTFFEQAGVGVVQIESSTGRFLRLNKKFADMLGYTIDEMLQLNYKSITHPDDLNRNLEQMNLLLKKQILEFSIEKRYIRKDGTILWTILTVTGMSEAIGGIMTNIAIAQDITERKKSEQDLIDSELKFRTVFELAGVGVAQVETSTGRFIKINKKFADIVGYTVAEMMHLTFHDFTHPDDIEKSLKYKNKLINEKNVKFSIEKRYVRKDRTIIWVNRTVTSMSEIGEGSKYHITIIEDITDTKKAEKVLKEENELFQTTMNAIDSIVYVADFENYKILFANKYTRDLFGNITDKKCYSALQGKTEPCDFCTNHLLIDAKGKAKQPHIWEFQNLLTKNWYQCHDQAIQWPNGKLVRFEIATDITQNKKNEQELKEREIKAKSAKRIAEAAMEAKQQFLANMSHEIRTPMTAITGFAKVMLKTDLTDKQKEYINAIKTSSDTLLVIINDILDLAKVDAGKITFEKAPFNLKSTLSAMLQLFDVKFKENNLGLVKEYDNSIPEVLIGDSVRLNQIILNLLSNAVKFTKKGKITIRVRLLNEDKEKVTIEFSITDTGIGIPANMLENIFEKFQQATSSTSKIFGGTGLGLAIVKQLVEKQGGTISVKSEIDKGSTFSFILSFQKTKAETKSFIGQTELELEKDIKNIKVLVVEDIALNQVLIKILLKDWGFEGDIAGNGKLAIEKLENNSYDIILMDLQMPVMNGFEATKYIRNKMKSKIPIIALTADVTADDLEKCKSIGMNDHIAKPIDEKLLYDKIVGLVKKL